MDNFPSINNLNERALAGNCGGFPVEPFLFYLLFRFFQPLGLFSLPGADFFGRFLACFYLLFRFFQPLGLFSLPGADFSGRFLACFYLPFRFFQPLRLFFLLGADFSGGSLACSYFLFRFFQPLGFFSLPGADFSGKSLTCSLPQSARITQIAPHSLRLPRLRSPRCPALLSGCGLLPRCCG